MKYRVMDMEHGFVASAWTWGSAKRKARKYTKEVGEDRIVVIVTKYKERR